MRKIKVLHVTSTRYGIGGVEKLLLDMSGRYDNERFDVAYCNLFGDQDGAEAYPTELRQRGLPLFVIKGKRLQDLPGIALRLFRLISDKKFDIVHLHMLQATIVGSLAAGIARLPVVVTKHYTPGPSHSGSGGPGRRPIQMLDLFFTRSARRVIAVSKYVRENLLENAVPAEKVKVIYNGIDTSAFDAGRRKTPTIEFPKEKFVVGTVGSLTQLKAHKYLIEAFASVCEQVEDSCLVIVGEGPELAELEGQASQLGIAEKVIFAGFRKDVPALVSQFDVYVQSSVFESFGLVLLEAMTAEKPVVATAVGGMPEIVVDGENGFLVPPKSAGAIAEALLRIWGDRDAAARMGQKGRSCVFENFEIAQTVSKYQDLYADLANSNL